MIVRDYEACPFCGRRDAVCKHSPRWGYFVACKCKATGTPAGSESGAWKNWDKRSEPIQERMIDLGY